LGEGHVAKRVKGRERGAKGDLENKGRLAEKRGLTGA